MEEIKPKHLILGRYINQKTLMEELKIGTGTLKELRHRGLEVIVIGRQILYDSEDIKRIFEQLKQR
ncbi:hypothetical protein [Vagococcus fluvialis]|uniref:hypothetical protein n=1 Tax=Vagococcus fluvialis TaxID=2738 RepID=UPI0037892B27